MLHDQDNANPVTTGQHVVIVEDSQALSEAFRIMLERSGFRVTVANSLGAAVVIPDRADVLLIDISLPDGDGIALIERLEKLGRPPQFAVALTGHDDQQTRERCISAGCADVIVKPIAVTALVEKVKNLLR
jgi:DNA-binding response OmpR family regulator